MKKNANEKLAKLKTRKGGLGKKWAPRWLTTYEGDSGKNGAMKRILLPGELKTRKGGSGKNGIRKWKNEKLKSIDHRCEHPMFTQHWHA
jgi:hypothetical protein